MVGPDKQDVDLPNRAISLGQKTSLMEPAMTGIP